MSITFSSWNWKQSAVMVGLAAAAIVGSLVMSGSATLEFNSSPRRLVNLPEARLSPNEVTRMIQLVLQDDVTQQILSMERFFTVGMGMEMHQQAMCELMRQLELESAAVVRVASHVAPISAEFIEMVTYCNETHTQTFPEWNANHGARCSVIPGTDNGLEWISVFVAAQTELDSDLMQFFSQMDTTSQTAIRRALTGAYSNILTPCWRRDLPYCRLGNQDLFHVSVELDDPRENTFLGVMLQEYLASSTEPFNTIEASVLKQMMLVCAQPHHEDMLDDLAQSICQLPDTATQTTRDDCRAAGFGCVDEQMPAGTSLVHDLLVEARRHFSCP